MSAYICLMRNLGTRMFLFFGLGFGLFSTKIRAQEIIVNEYKNASAQNDEWTELVVVKDDLDLRGWYMGDNNSSTSSWQPKIRFSTSAPLWNHLRAGTVIIIDHATGTDDSNCDDVTKYDYDKSDGFLRVCCRNPSYFEGGGTSTLFLSEGGDFVQLVNPSGKMVHGIGHDADPNGSVIGTPCYSTSANWTDINTANGDTPPCPDGPFTFYEFGIQSTSSLIMLSGTLAGFSSGIQSTTSNGKLELSETPFEGIGNGSANNQWLTDLRAPDFTFQTICPVKLDNFTINFTWNNMTDPVSTDQTCGYMVVRNTTDNFGLPAQGKEYSIGSTYGSGIQTVTVVALLDNTGAATTTYTEPGTGDFFYRVFPYRYKNTMGFEHPTRGRTYNTVDFVKVNGSSMPAIPVINDTLCSPGLATLVVPPIPMPNPGGIAWYENANGGSPILINKDTLRFAVSQTTSFWVEFPNSSWCNGQRIEVKALVQPLLCPYTSPDSVCEGVPAIVIGDTRPDLNYKWTPISGPTAVSFSGEDSSLFSISTPSTNKKEWVVFSLSCTNNQGCQSQTIQDSIYTVPFECSLYSLPDVAVPGKPLLVKVKSDRNPWQVAEWMVSKSEVLDKTFTSLNLIPESTSPEVKAEIHILDPRDGIVCKAIRSLPTGIINLVLSNGSPENRFLDFGSKEIQYLQIFNRWGQKVSDFGAGYKKEWPDDKVDSGVYFYQAGTKGGVVLSGWVELIR